MKLIYLTSKRYPASTADHFYVSKMAEAFAQILGSDFTFLIAGKVIPPNTNAKTVSAPPRFRTVFYFFWITFFLLKNDLSKEDVFFFSNDPKLLSILIFWRNTLHFKYRIVSDWHMLHGKGDSKIAQRSDLLISTSLNLKRLIVQKSDIDQKKVLVAYGGTDPDIFSGPATPFRELHPEFGLKDTDTCIGYVGFFTTMGMSKGMETMIESLKYIEDKTIKMIFVGARGEEQKKYSDRAEELGVGKRVIVLPAVSAEYVPKYEKSMAALVIPYPDKPHFRDFGFPMKVYEYMASGRPIFYSNLPIIAEMLSDCAISFRPDDPQDVAKKISDTVKNPGEAFDLSVVAYEKVKQFAWHKRAEKILEHIKL